MSLVLIVDDDANYCALVETVLRRDGFEVCSAQSLSEAQSKLKSQSPEAIVLDLSLPDSPRDKTVEAIKTSTQAAIVVVSGSGDDNTADNCIMQSASGFINKDEGLRYLGSEIRNAIRTCKRIASMQSAIKILE